VLLYRFTGVPFRVGNYQLDVPDALEMIARAVEHALRAYVAHVKGPPGAVYPHTAHGDAGYGSGHRSRAHALIKVSLAGAQRDLDLLAAQVKDGARVQITTERGSVVLMAWDEWTALQEKRAQLEAAWWSAMRTGELDARQYAADVSRVLGDPGAPHD